MKSMTGFAKHTYILILSHTTNYYIIMYLKSNEIELI